MGAVFKLLTARSRHASRLYSTSVSSSSCVHRCKLLVVGGGAGGCSVAWRLSRHLKSKEIIVLEPSQYHYNQPLFTLVAAGIKQLQQARKPLLSVLPRPACWFHDYCAQFDPGQCRVYTDCGDVICYEYLVVALGLVNQYDQIPGLQKALDDPRSGVSTIYSPDYCHKTWRMIRKHCGGHAVFTFPSTVGKCAGAAQKIMYLADDYWRKKGRRDCSSISYFTGGSTLFGVPKYASALEKVAACRCIATNFRSELLEVQPCGAVFQVGSQRVTVPYTFLHVTPPMCPPEVLRCSELVNPAGFMDVDPHTLRHRTFPNVYGLGDCTSTPNSKTAAAVAPQSYIVEQNLLSTMAGQEPKAKYDGYGSCPMLTSYRRGILAEFKYDKKVCETFPFDQSVERRLFYLLKTKYFPYLYWNKLIKGKWNGPRKLRRIINPTGR